MNITEALLAGLFGLLVAGAAFLGASTIVHLTKLDRVARLASTASLIVLFGAVLGGIGAHGAPTGQVGVDAMYRGGFVALIAAAAGLAALPILALGALGILMALPFGRVDAVPVALASVVLGTLGALRWGRRGTQNESAETTGATGATEFDRPLRILAGGCLANALLRLPTDVRTLVPTGIAGLVAGVVVLAGLAAATRRTRRFAGLAILVGGAITGVGAAGAAIAARGSRSSADRGIAAARLAIAAVRRGDATSASAGFRDAATLLHEAQDGLSARDAVLGRYLPVVAPNLNAAKRLTRAGAQVATSAGRAVGAVDLHGLRGTDGRIDVDALAALQAPMAGVRADIAVAIRELDDSLGPWTAAAITRQARSLRAELYAARGTSAAAGRILDALPGLLGRDGPRRYLLVVPTPAEARGSGGLIGNYGEILADHGAITLSRFGRTIELNTNGVPPAERVLHAPADYMRRYAPFEVSKLWQNVTLSPDFPSAAEAMASLYPQSGGTHVDGIISADPFALAAILRLTGPIEVDGWPVPITADNAPTILLHDWYAQLTETRNKERIDLQGRVASEAWSRLLHSPLPALTTLGSTFGEVARQRHLQFWAERSSEQQFFRRLGLDGAVAPLAGDGFAAITNNAGANKIEWYLHRTITYDATVDLSTGAVTSTATIDMRNDAPAGGEAPYLIANGATPPAPDGTSIQYVSLYSPLKLQRAIFDGVVLATTHDTELGRNVYAAWIRIPPGRSGVLAAEFAGTLSTVPAAGYRLELGCQPLVNDDEARVRIRIAPGTKAVVATNLQPASGSFAANESLTCGKRYRVRLAG